MADVFYLDYGDSEYVATHELCELRADLLRLRFQVSIINALRVYEYKIFLLRPISVKQNSYNDGPYSLGVFYLSTFGWCKESWRNGLWIS